MRCLFTSFFALLLLHSGFAQVVSHRLYGDETLEKKFKENKIRIEQRQPKFDSNEKNEIRRNWNQARLDQQLEMLKAGSLLVQSPLQHFVDSLVQSIKQANGLHPKYTVFVTDELNPNAFSTGDGFLFVNASLLAHLHSANELEFILCHELAHDTLAHYLKKLRVHVDTYVDKQLKKDLKAASLSDYSPRAKTEFILKSKMAKSMANSRTAEFQADSLGLEYYKTLNKPIESAYSALWTLDDIDLQQSERNVDLESICERWMKGVYDPSWLEREEGSLGASAYKPPQLDDSLKTHPDIPLRIERLVGHPTEKPRNLRVEASFQKIIDQTEIELDFAWLEYGNFGRAFYRQCQRWEKYQRTKDAAMLAVTVSLLAKARKQRVIAKHVSLEAEFLTDNYNRCLHLLNSMTFENYGAFFHQLEEYCLANEPDALTLELLASSKYIFKSIPADEKTATKNCEEFLAKYPNGIMQRFICISNN